MRTSTISAREFNQHVSRAKRAANDGPVIITERGKPAYVLMRHDVFAKMFCDEGSDIQAKTIRNAALASSRPS